MYFSLVEQDTVTDRDALLSNTFDNSKIIWYRQQKKILIICHLFLCWCTRFYWFYCVADWKKRKEKKLYINCHCLSLPAGPGSVFLHYSSLSDSHPVWTVRILRNTKCVNKKIRWIITSLHNRNRSFTSLSVRWQRLHVFLKVKQDLVRKRSIISQTQVVVAGTNLDQDLE